MYESSEIMLPTKLYEYSIFILTVNTNFYALKLFFKKS